MPISPSPDGFGGFGRRLESPCGAIKAGNQVTFSVENSEKGTVATNVQVQVPAEEAACQGACGICVCQAFCPFGVCSFVDMSVGPGIFRGSAAVCSLRRHRTLARSSVLIQLVPESLRGIFFNHGR